MFFPLAFLERLVVRGIRALMRWYCVWRCAREIRKTLRFFESQMETMKPWDRQKMRNLAAEWHVRREAAKTGADVVETFRWLSVEYDRIMKEVGGAE